MLRDGVPVPGAYVAGWAKRGPTGVIGTNKHDARETVRSLLEDAEATPSRVTDDPAAVLKLLAERDVEVVSWAGWRAIARAEADRGAGQGRARAKICDRAEMLRLAAGC